MVFEFPNKEGAKYRIKSQYENYIGGVIWWSILLLNSLSKS